MAEELPEEDIENTPNVGNKDSEHKNVMFQRNKPIETPSEDSAQKPIKELLFSMNKDFHHKVEKLHSVDSRGESRDGSKGGSIGRTYIGEKAVFSSRKYN